MLIQAYLDMIDRNTFNRELKGLQSARKELSIDSGTIVTDAELEIPGNCSTLTIPDSVCFWHPW